MKVYRFEVRELGIYEAVDKDCPRDDKRRENKPDGSWLPKVGQKYPGAISYWTENGLKKYEESGLKNWHLSVTEGSKIMKVSRFNGEALYQDNYQVIAQVDKFKLEKEVQL